MDTSLIITGILCCGLGVVIGAVIVAFLIGSHRDVEHEDTMRLDYLLANQMSLDVSPNGTTWAVLDGFPRAVFTIGLNGRQAIDAARDGRAADIGATRAARH